MKKGFIHTFCEQGNARDSTRLVYAVKIMIYDVTVPITNTMPIWPGDPPVELVPMSHESRNKTHIVNLTAIAMGSHTGTRSEEHTSELQSLTNLVCRLLLEKK